MKKVLIISYFFPPCNLTASQRVASWAEHFHASGLYPVIITRNWDHPVKSPEDILKPGGKKIIHEKNERYEVYYLPHTGSFRDRLYQAVAKTSFAFLSKPFTLLELIGQNYFSLFTPFRYIKRFAKKILEESPDIEHLLISANPFILFKYGYELKKQFPKIKWIADYRDDWTTSEINPKEGFLRSRIHRIESGSEKKWLSNADFITSVSPYYTQKIAGFAGKEGITVYNGLDELMPGQAGPQPVFNIVYNGTLYATQPIEDFCDSIKQVMAEEKEVSVRIKFPGLAFDPVQAERVKKCMAGYEHMLEITERIPKAEVMQIQETAHILLMLSHPGVKGITSSKLFEYLSLRRPILLYPGDRDIVNEIMRKTNAGMICTNKEEMMHALRKYIGEYKTTGTTTVHSSEQAILEYSRKNQSAALCRYILSQKK